jgi:2-C-methyl-D-erythritol 4-phosphate cytidylyltransferase/2-C-methyl-D-erythritol 2,4-cyclodiphosphate synthase
MTINPSDIAILIVAGGNGTRMDSDIPKQYLHVNGKPIIRHTIEKLIPFGRVQSVIGQGHDNFYQQAVEGLHIPAPVMGGTTRQESVRLGLLALEKSSPAYVLIHDAARPCFRPQDIHNLIHSLQSGHGATLATPVAEAIQRDGDVVNRDNLWMIQTPQAFPCSIIRDCHLKAHDEGFNATDDTAIYRHYGFKVDYVPCGRHNLKITTQDDLIMAEKLLSNTMETKVGMGFDVHAFDEKVATSIRLCGIDIPHNKSLKGHSDADVGLHAITDAILGAMAEGDIGSHFPPSDDMYKDMDSHIFLDKSVDILYSKGGSLTHIDLIIICEEPKIGKHRTAIQRHLSDHLKLSTSRISIKATTSEQLGFTGRREGIAAQAVVTIKVPVDD